MRFRLANPANSTYLSVEPFLNNMKLISINAGTELALAVALVDANGNHIPLAASTATITTVADSAASQQLLAASTTRLGLYIFNDSTATLYVKFGTTASSTDFTLLLRPNGLYSMENLIYRGRIDGIWSSDAAGNARITELTA